MQLAADCPKAQATNVAERCFVTFPQLLDPAGMTFPPVKHRHPTRLSPPQRLQHLEPPGPARFPHDTSIGSW